MEKTTVIQLCTCYTGMREGFPGRDVQKAVGHAGMMLQKKFWSRVKNGRTSSIQETANVTGIKEVAPTGPPCCALHTSQSSRAQDHSSFRYKHYSISLANNCNESIGEGIFFFFLKDFICFFLTEREHKQTV